MLNKEEGSIQDASKRIADDTRCFKQFDRLVLLLQKGLPVLRIDLKNPRVVASVILRGSMIGNRSTQWMVGTGESAEISCPVVQRSCFHVAALKPVGARCRQSDADSFPAPR